MMKTKTSIYKFYGPQPCLTVVRTVICAVLMLHLTASKATTRTESNTFNEPDSVKNVLVKKAEPLALGEVSKAGSPREDNQEYGAGPAATIQSLMLPGWGLFSTSRGQERKYYFALTPLSYGLILYGFGQKIGSNKLYKEYAASKDQKVMDESIKKAYEKRQSFLNCVGSGIAIYVFQAGATYIWGRYNDVYRARAEDWKQNVAFNVTPYYDLMSKSCKVNTSLNFTLGNKKKREFKNPFGNNKF